MPGITRARDLFEPSLRLRILELDGGSLPRSLRAPKIQVSRTWIESGPVRRKKLRNDCLASGALRLDAPCSLGIALDTFLFVFVDNTTRNIKVVYLGSNLALSTTQFEALARVVGESNAEVHALSSTDDNEQLHLVQLTWNDDRLRRHDSLTTRLWLYQVPTNPMFIGTRTQILKGVDFLVLSADGRLPVRESARWIDELKNQHGFQEDALVIPEFARLIIQYVCPPGSKNDRATLKAELDPNAEFAELSLDDHDPEQLAMRTMELIVDAIAAELRTAEGR